MLNPCARESQARAARGGVDENNKLISDNGLIYSYDSQLGAAHGQHFYGTFQGGFWLWTGGG